MRSLSVKAYAAGLAITVILALVAWAAMRRGSPDAGTHDPAYSADVAITSPKVLSAQSLMAGGVVYYDGVLENRGDRSLTGLTVALTFNDIDGKPIETVQRQLWDASYRPIPPHGHAQFEIGFDTVPASWNQAPPDPKVVAAYVH